MEYYDLSFNQDGFLLNVYSSEEGFIDSIDACSFLDFEKLQRWEDDYDITAPSLDECLAYMQYATLNEPSLQFRAIGTTKKQISPNETTDYIFRPIQQIEANDISFLSKATGSSSSIGAEHKGYAYHHCLQFLVPLFFHLAAGVVLLIQSLQRLLNKVTKFKIRSRTNPLQIIMYRPFSLVVYMGSWSFPYLTIVSFLNQIHKKEVIPIHFQEVKPNLFDQYFFGDIDFEQYTNSQVYIPLTTDKFRHDVAKVSVFGTGNHKKIHIDVFKSLRVKGLEDIGFDEEPKKQKLLVNDKKLNCNIRRARCKIFEYAYCNEWDYFATITLNPTYDRQNLKQFSKDLHIFMNHYSRKCKVNYLLIPELHSDGKSWHMHGFFKGIPQEDLHQFVLGDKMSSAIAKKVRNGEIVFHWKPYTEKFGFNDLEPIRSHEAVSKYITKYINKNLAKSVVEVGAHLYYCSKGLHTSQTKKIGTLDYDLENPVFANDYVVKYELPYDENILNDIMTHFKD